MVGEKKKKACEYILHPYAEGEGTRAQLKQQLRFHSALSYTGVARLKTMKWAPTEETWGVPQAALIPGRHPQFCLARCRSGFENIPHFCDTFVLRGDQKGAGGIDTVHTFRDILPGQRGEEIPCRARKEAAGAAGAQVSYLSSCLLQQALSSSL